MASNTTPSRRNRDKIKDVFKFRKKAAHVTNANAALSSANASSSSIPLRPSQHSQALGTTSQDGQGALWEKAYDALCAKDKRLKIAIDELVLEPLQVPIAQTQGSGTSPSWTPQPYEYSNLLSNTIATSLRKIEQLRYSFNLAGHEIVVKQKFETIAKRVSNFQTSFGSVVNANPYASIAWAGISVILAAFKQNPAAITVIDQISEILSRYEVIDRLYLRIDQNNPDVHGQRLLKHKDLRKLQIYLESRIVELFTLVLETQVRLTRHYSKSQGLRILRNIALSDNWEESQKELQKLDAAIKHDLKIFDSNTVQELLRQCVSMEANLSIEIKSFRTDYLTAEGWRAIASLPQVHSADFRSYAREHDTGCLPNTRTQLLAQIMDWSSSTQTQNIFWLCGMAGTGKSTIARTVAETLDESSRLAANFFFSRFDAERSDGSRFVSTIAAQVAEALPQTREFIAKAIEDNATIYERALPEQWRRLIYQPLSQIQSSVLIQPIVIVIDALDECVKENDIRQLVALFATFVSISSIHLKLFLTSRPETRRLGRGKTSYQDFILQDIEETIVEHDLTVFFTYRLELIRKENSYLGDIWPSQEDIRVLVKRARKLFIYAATTCRFIGDPSFNPQKRLEQILEEKTSGTSATEELDSMYLTILEVSVPSSIHEEENRELIIGFHHALDAIVVAFEPLSLASVSSLTKVPTYELERRVSSLVSVLDIPTSVQDPVHILHPSFADFLQNGQRCKEKRFQVENSKVHSALARQCLALLNTALKRNICHLKTPGILAEEIESDRLDDYISPALRYACRFWVEHVKQSSQVLKHIGSIFEFLKAHFLHWLEVLALLGRIDDGVKMVMFLESELKEGNTLELQKFIYNAKRFILRNRRPLEIAPLQVYFTSLVFIPENSLITRYFTNDVLQYFQQPMVREEDWPATLSVLEGHSSRVNAVVFSPDGQLLASASNDNTVRLWDAATGASRAVLEGHSDWVNAVVFSPDSQLLASASDDNTVRLWDAATGASRAVLEGHSNQVNAVVFSPDGQLLASASSDNTVRLWDAATGASRAVLEGHSYRVNAVVFSPDGQLLASASSDNTVRLWDAATGASRAVLEGHSNRVNAVVFSPDGQLLASASSDKTVRLWDAATGASRAVLEGHSYRVNAVVFSPDGQLLASASSDNTVRLWDAATGASRAVLEGHSSIVNAVVFSPDGQLLASASYDKTVRLWDAATGASRAVLEGHSYWVNAVVFSPDSQLLASASSDNTVRLWDAATGASRAVLEGHSNRVNAVVFSPDGQLLASASSDKTVRLWDAATGASRAVLEGYSGRVSAVVFSPDGQLLASASDDNTVRLWDAATGASRAVLEGHSSIVNAVVFSPDGQLLASASSDNTVRLWDAATGASRAVLEGHSYRVNAVVFSPDGQLLASASSDNTVRLWDAATGASRAVLEGHSNRVNAVVFSPDGQLLASASSDNTVRLWDAATGASRAVLEGHSHWVNAVVFSPDGQLLASASYDETVRLWDAVELRCIRTLISQDPLYDLFYSNKESFWINVDIIGYPNTSDPSSITITTYGISQLSTSQDESWVTYRGIKWLWLPPEIRATDREASAAVGRTLCLGSGSGRMTFLILKPDIDPTFIDTS